MALSTLAQKNSCFKLQIHILSWGWRASLSIFEDVLLSTTSHRRFGGLDIVVL